MTHSLIDTIFNFINFAARVGILLYLIKKYIVPKISGSILYEKESVKILERQHGELKNQCTEIEKNIKDQEQLYFDLQNKFAIWQAALVQDQQKRDQICKIYEQKLIYQLEKKQQYAQRKYIIEQELPILLQKVEQDLQATMKESPQLGKKYLEDLLDLTTGKDL